MGCHFWHLQQRKGSEVLCCVYFRWQERASVHVGLLPEASTKLCC